jgi:3-methyladenine DNA glycosylase/8-oxoguanine DNA glycosylase
MSSVRQLRHKIAFKLTIPDPFDFQLTVAKPAGWHWSTLGETLENGVFSTGMHMSGKPIGLSMSARRNTVEATAYSAADLTVRERDNLIAIIRSGLGAEDDLAGLYRFARTDPILSATVKDLYGMRVGLLDDVFGRVVLAILLQMAPLARSERMMAALLECCGESIAFVDKKITLWPKPEDIVRFEADELQKRANLGYRAKRLIQAARFLGQHPISLRRLSLLPDEEALKRLTEIPGIGEYSAGIIMGRVSLPIDAWSVVVLSELVLGRTPENARREIDAVIGALTERWGRWRWMAFVYIVNDLEHLARSHHLSRVR